MKDRLFTIDLKVGTLGEVSGFQSADGYGEEDRRKTDGVNQKHDENQTEHLEILEVEDEVRKEVVEDIYNTARGTGNSFREHCHGDRDEAEREGKDQIEEGDNHCRKLTGETGDHDDHGTERNECKQQIKLFEHQHWRIQFMGIDVVRQENHHFGNKEKTGADNQHAEVFPEHIADFPDRFGGQFRIRILLFFVHCL